MNIEMTHQTCAKNLLPMFALAAVSVLAAACLFVPPALLAQTIVGGQQEAGSQQSLRQYITDQEIQLMRQDVRAERRQLVAANLPLTTEESSKFWPVYDQYIAETIKINDTRYALLKDYAANYSNMTDAKAADFISKIIEVDKALIELREKYIPIVEQVLPKRKAAMFLQIDRRLQLMIDLQLASQIPLISRQ